MAKRKQAEVKTLGRKLRPSNADRYLNCPASVVVSQDMPTGDSTFYADKGTVVHAVIENCINTGREPESYIGTMVCEVDMEVDAEMATSAKFCLEYIKSQGFTTVEAETMLTMDWVDNPDGEVTTGRIDFLGYDEDFEILKVGDYKNGFMSVPEDSYQMAMYLYGLTMDTDSKYKHLKSFQSVIVQPNSSQGAVILEKTWTTSDMIKLKSLVKFTTDWVKKTKVSDLKLNDYCEGHWCKFCPISKTNAGNKMCPKKASGLFDEPAGTQALEMASDKLPAPTTMTPEQRAFAISKRKEIVKWLNDVYELELANAISGHVLPGLRLAEGKSKVRYWVKGIELPDIIESLVEAGLMEDEVFDKKLVSPATVKKLFKGKFPSEVEALLTPDGKNLELVPDDSKDLFD